MEFAKPHADREDEELKLTVFRGSVTVAHFSGLPLRPESSRSVARSALLLVEHYSMKPYLRRNPAWGRFAIVRNVNH
jgi:hypothetical protein